MSHDQSSCCSLYFNSDDPNPIIADADLHSMRTEKSSILLIGPSGSVKIHWSSPWLPTAPFRL
jgi:hypothetical protein